MSSRTLLRWKSVSIAYCLYHCLIYLNFHVKNIVWSFTFKSNLSFMGTLPDFQIPVNIDDATSGLVYLF